jgi:branched-chain amino acid transport system substrate-binding protein
MIPALRRSGYAGPYVVADYGVTEDTIRQAVQRVGDDHNIYYVTRYSTIFDNNPAVAEVAAAQKKYGTSKPFSGNQITGWALGKFVEAALKTCGWPCSGEKLDQAMQTLKVDTTGLTGGPIEMSPQDHYGPTYWRLYVWDEAAQRMEPKSDWLKITALAFPAR